MSWFRAIAVCLCLCLSLAACGFDPLYGEKNIAAETPSLSGFDIEIANIPDRDGQYLRNFLIDRLNAAGRPADAPWILKISPLEKTTVNTGIRKDASATRAQLKISTRMQLVEKATNEVLFQRDIKTTGAYNLLDNQMATLMSQDNITESLLREIGEDAVRELGLYVRRRGTSP